MGKVTAQMSMSLDGFIAGPDASQDNPIGTNGDRLHDWMFANPAKQNSLTELLRKNTGAAIIGYNVYYEALPHWDGTGPLGDDIPTFVLVEPGNVPKDAAKAFTFVTDGIESALRQAQAVAGDKDVWLGGGANTIQQYLKAGLLDEFQLHIVPIILGGGTRMFGDLGFYRELEKEVTDEPGVTHFVLRPKKQ